MKMESEEKKFTPLELLFERASAYSKTSLELLKLKTVEQGAGTVSSVVPRLCLFFFLLLFLFVINIGVALWLGEILGKAYYGFFAIAVFYAVVVAVLLAMHAVIKKRVYESIIKETLS